MTRATCYDAQRDARGIWKRVRITLKRARRQVARECRRKLSFTFEGHRWLRLKECGDRKHRLKSMTIGVIDSQKSIFYSVAIRRAGKAKKSLWARSRDVEDPEIQGSGFVAGTRQRFPRNHWSVSKQQGIRTEMEVFGKGAKPVRLL